MLVMAEMKISDMWSLILALGRDKRLGVISMFTIIIVKFYCYFMIVLNLTFSVRS